mmetsp:Transcript_42990/g.118897  ORF Transcript_42990/g.118897 Transcript_42990/m.118897 type:complete len:218 (-) Transcript_42990:167-820(-)|eukprot:CAMPEP_0117590892 /NCGR_PEP_ID=MMETSP0784-20121206/71225_1 /TAXON_ID=39447 /ORGANISM="" /LENGTH=217 /DNA_ID=CAMNT_0005392545 /DNA_START=26 /DNA_END=679 /DNA_ORIENTATION=-
MFICCFSEGSKPVEVEHASGVPVKALSGHDEDVAHAPGADVESLVFDIVLRKASPSEPLGLVVTETADPPGLFVRAAREIAAEALATPNPGGCFLPGDEILKVNGVTGSPAALSAAMTDVAVVEIQARRLVKYRLSVVKKKTLGLKACEDTLEVVRILPGEICEYNKRVRPALQVFAGDKVVAANGVTESPAAVLEKIASVQEGEVVELTMSRGYTR